jgi:hypothetical protein
MDEYQRMINRVMDALTERWMQEVDRRSVTVDGKRYVWRDDAEELQKQLADSLSRVMDALGEELPTIADELVGQDEQTIKGRIEEFVVDVALPKLRAIGSH